MGRRQNWCLYATRPVPIVREATPLSTHGAPEVGSAEVIFKGHGSTVAIKPGTRATGFLSTRK
jgi:hypothetical protein